MFWHKRRNDNKKSGKMKIFIDDIFFSFLLVLFCSLFIPMVCNVFRSIAIKCHQSTTKWIFSIDNRKKNMKFQREKCFRLFCHIKWNCVFIWCLKSKRRIFAWLQQSGHESKKKRERNKIMTEWNQRDGRQLCARKRCEKWQRQK